MRHNVFGKKLNRDVKERKALFRSLIDQMIIHGKIRITISKAKAVRGLIEKIVTHAKAGTNTSIRQIATIVQKKELIDKLVKDIAPRFKDRIGGYIRIIRVGKRRGDATEEAIMEWTHGQIKTSEPSKEKKQTQKKEIKKVKVVPKKNITKKTKK